MDNLPSLAGQSIARSELVLGGQKSGKSRRAEQLAQAWLAESAHHRAVMLATAKPWDDEMRSRIARHRADRAVRLPGMPTVEEPLQLAAAITAHSSTETLVLVDCLTLWLTNQSVAFQTVDLGQNKEQNTASEQEIRRRIAHLLIAIGQAPGPVVLVSNEIGLGVVPMGREVRAFVDALGLLNQSVAAACARVTLMAAGLPLILKDTP